MIPALPICIDIGRTTFYVIYDGKGSQDEQKLHYGAA